MSVQLALRFDAEGYPIKREHVAALGPYLTRHIKRFGDYFIDLSVVPQPLLETDLKLALWIEEVKGSAPMSYRTFIADIPNYYLKTRGRYYFSGMHTAILPMIPGIYAIYRVVRASKASIKKRPLQVQHALITADRQTYAQNIPELSRPRFRPRAF